MRIPGDSTTRTILMDHAKYAKDILVEHNMSDCKPSSLPMGPGFFLCLAHMDSP
jgi:hypothetical protein